MQKDRYYHRFSGLTIASVLLLFFLGGLVRVTGSGMGCPDWPKCFGSWVPPTSEAQLPNNYKDIYTEKRKIKVERLIAFLNKVGMHEKASEIQGTPGLLEPHAFSFSKAYVEYGNRLVGALTGIFALLAAFFSLAYWKSAFWKMGFTFIGLFFIVYNGWLGSLVVDSNLFGGMITVHFVIAFLAFYFFLMGYLHGKSSISVINGHKYRLGLVSAALILGIVQLISGTLVRERAEVLHRMQTTLSIENFEMLGSGFNLHRITAPILGIILLYVWYKNRSNTQSLRINQYYLLCVVLLFVQIVSGSINVRFNLPPLAQLLHVVAGSLLLSGLIFITIQEFKVKKV